ncbi:MAG: saccharopine dehydrogenase [bacterium]|nr:saccharopine dehydrogenase [bacterium]
MKVIVLGAGLVGGPMAADLARDEEFKVTVADISEEALASLSAAQPWLTTVRADLSDTAKVRELVAGHDLVLNAVPGFMGYQTLKAIIEAGRNVVDIAFFPENCLELDALAKEKGVTAIVDCGVAPGMSNVLIGHVDNLLDRTESALIYVGGLPEVREWPFEYRAVFSPIDVIEEYTRPARYVENGKLVVREALSEPELLNFPGIGTLEAFNSDGLRTLAETIDAPNLKEKTLRYQGHIEKMAVLRELGLFSEEPVEVKGVQVRPIDLTAKLMFPQWEMKPGEVDITVMQVIIEGERGGKRVRYTYDLLDRYDPATNVHSMARTTGYTATVALRMLAAGLYAEKGVSPPEFVGRHEACVDFLLKGLEERGIIYRLNIEEM